MYDLAIIGASPEGISAAQRGISTYPASRIALITQGWERVWTERVSTEKSGDQSDWAEIEATEKLRQLAALGVDVIPAIGHFKQTGSELVWQGDQRTITAQAYLLTTAVERYQATHNAVNSTNWVNLTPSGATTWGIRGASPQHLVLAQTLVQQGHAVQLFTRNAYLLPGEDREMSHLLQCYLEAQGIKIWCHCHRFVPTFLPKSQTYQLSVESGAISHRLEVNQLWQRPSSALPWHWFKTLPDFRNESESHAPYVAVNDSLQTAHPQIYACGGWLKGYPSVAIAIQESRYGVDRILSNMQRPINYAHIPFGINLNSPWYRVGLSEQQATAQWKKIHVYYGYEAYQGDSPLRGVCKILANHEDQIVGAHWFGTSAPAGIALLTLGMTGGITVETLKNLPVVDRGVAQGLQALSRG
ncbi:MAG: hypothetical protein RLZZ490_503 [Cyanobacteriota bacterium]|jgi:pyruvate/2-oxoglutarate dehydrogenase complex dihydrolipoamide dehydrogenase (E3) component